METNTRSYKTIVTGLTVAFLFVFLFTNFPDNTIPNAQAAAAFVQSASATNDISGTTLTAAFPSNNTAGNLIAVAMSFDSSNGTTWSCSDTRGNTYTQATFTNDLRHGQAFGICYAANITAGANTVTVSFGGISQLWRRMAIAEYSGVVTATPVDVTVTNNSGTNSASPTTNSLTTTQAGDLIFAAMTPDSGTTTISAGSGFNLRQATNNIAIEDQIQTNAGAIAGTFTLSTPLDYIAHAVAFKASGGGTPPPPPPPADTTPPTVSIFAPTNGATVSGSTTISANASDNVSVAGVTFKLDGNDITSEDTSAPYSISWDTTQTSNGSHTLTATARDTSNNNATSSSVAVTVSNVIAPPPPPPGTYPWSGIIDPTRAVDWRSAGVVGGIPSSSWPNCTTAACNTLFGGSVTAATINSALSSAPNNTVVRIPAGTFSITCLSIGRSNVVLRGAGANQTRLNFTSACGGNGYGTNRVINIGGGATGTPRFGGVTTANWTAGYAKDTTTITLSSTAGLTAGPVGTGTLLFLDQNDDAADGWPAVGDIYSCATTAGACSMQGGNNYAFNGRAQVQVVTVTGINGNQVTISPGVAYPNWRASQNPGAFWNNGSPSQNVGVEDLFIDMTPTAATSGVWVVNCANCWVKGNKIVRTDSAPTAAAYYIWVIQSSHVTVNSNYVFGRPIPTGSSFPLENYEYSDYISSDLLVENNIFHHMVSGVLPNDPGGRNVYAYNYNVGGFLGIAGFQLHSGNIMMNLFEGNDFSHFMGDTAHARHHFMTLFRNVISGGANNSSQTETGGVDLETGNRFFNLIGNVLGYSGWNTYECNLSACTGNQAFTLGWVGNTSSKNGGQVFADANVKRTLLRWGNWDNITNSTRWNAAEVPSTITSFSNPVPSTQTLPTSFYLSGRPVWWGSMPFPAIGPDVSGGNITNSPTGGHAYKIPARTCFESQATDTSFGNLGVKLFDANSCYPVSGSTPTPIAGDINSDHIVNSIDYSILNSHWFTNDSSSDLNHDGLVNAIDYSILNSNWFKTW